MLSPHQEGIPFPKTFVSVTLRNIFKRLFRVYAHMYYSHFETFVSYGAEAHLNTTFKHLYYFITEFDLVDSNELAPLQDLIDKMTSKKKRSSTSSKKSSGSKGKKAAASSSSAAKK